VQGAWIRNSIRPTRPRRLHREACSLWLIDSGSGGLEIYDIANNAITGAFFLGNVGLDWQYAGVGPIQDPGTSNLVLRNVNTGAFQAYNIAGNTLVGSARLGCGRLELAARRLRRLSSERRHGQFRKFDLSARSGEAGFGSGSSGADNLNTSSIGIDTSQQTFLTTSQHT
jgi:hypothetical protein